MAKNTAEYSSHHRDHYDDYRDDDLKQPTNSTASAYNHKPSQEQTQFANEKTDHPDLTDQARAIRELFEHKVEDADHSQRFMIAAQLTYQMTDSYQDDKSDHFKKAETTGDEHTAYLVYEANQRFEERMLAETSQLRDRLTVGAYDDNTIIHTIETVNEARQASSDAFTHIMNEPDETTQTDYPDWHPQQNHAYQSAMNSFPKVLESTDLELHSAYLNTQGSTPQTRTFEGQIVADLTSPAVFKSVHPDEAGLYKPLKWMDPALGQDALHNISESFHKATEDLSEADRKWAAHLITHELTKPVTHTLKYRTTQYHQARSSKPIEEYIKDVTQAHDNANDHLDHLRDQLTDTLAAEAVSGPADLKETLDQMDNFAASANHHIAASIVESLEHRLNDSDSDPQTHYQHMAEAITEPIREQITYPSDYGNDPFGSYHNLLTSQRTGKLRSEEFTAGIDSPPPEPGTQEHSLSHIQEHFLNHRTYPREALLHEANKAAQELTEELTAHGTSESAVQHTLDTVVELQSSLDYQRSDRATARHLLDAIQTAEDDPTLPNKDQMARYTADAISYPARKRLSDYFENHTPQQYEERNEPYPQLHHEANNEAAHALLYYLEQLTESATQELAEHNSDNRLGEDLSKMTQLVYDVDNLYRTGEPSTEHNDHESNNFVALMAERTDLMVEDLEKHLLNNYPQDPGHQEDNSQKWIQRVEDPQLFQAMDQYTATLPEPDQLRVAKELIARYRSQE